MLRDTNNVIPVSMALLLHVIVFGSLFVALDFGRRDPPPVPLAITGTLVTETAVVIPPPEVEEAPEPEPPPPDPGPSEEERARLEEQKRLEDARIEAERLERIRQQDAEQQRLAAEAERKRKAEEERQRRAEEERQRQAREVELERQRLEAEQKRQEEIERQRAENERLRQEAEAARQAEINAESRRLEAMQATALQAYMFAIQQRIQQRWVRPASATANLECVVNIRQLPGGEVVDVSLGQCNGDSTVQRSILNAVRQASPLPTPRDPSVFDRNIRLIFRPDE